MPALPPKADIVHGDSFIKIVLRIIPHYAGTSLLRTGKISCGPLFFTLPTILSTGQIFKSSSRYGLSNAIGQSISARMTGIRSCSSAIALFG
jgi:hypothetical protein